MIGERGMGGRLAGRGKKGSRKEVHDSGGICNVAKLFGGPLNDPRGRRSNPRVDTLVRSTRFKLKFGDIPIRPIYKPFDAGNKSE